MDTCVGRLGQTVAVLVSLSSLVGDTGLCGRWWEESPKRERFPRLVSRVARSFHVCWRLREWQDSQVSCQDHRPVPGHHIRFFPLVYQTRLVSLYTSNLSRTQWLHDPDTT